MFFRWSEVQSVRRTHVAGPRSRPLVSHTALALAAARPLTLISIKSARSPGTVAGAGAAAEPVVVIAVLPLPMSKPETLARNLSNMMFLLLFVVELYQIPDVGLTGTIYDLLVVVHARLTGFCPARIVTGLLAVPAVRRNVFLAHCHVHEEHVAV